jgi:uncharacterized Fe-S cluster-containing radical SAM superfamily enzyme
LRKISVAGQGDPWASPHYRDILSRLAAPQTAPLALAIYTNGILMSRETWERFRGLERHELSVCVSVDAASAFTYARLRPPGAGTS